MMDDAQRKLLEDHKTIILPEDIDHDSYALIAEAAILYPDDEIDLYCRGDGGCSRSALEIANVIKQHGHFVGLLTGEAYSTHVSIWAACQSRYCYEFSTINVHKVTVSFSDDDTLTSWQLRIIADGLDQTELAVSKILADASNIGVRFWRDAQEIGDAQYKFKTFDCDEIIGMGMALPIADRVKVSLPSVSNGGVVIDDTLPDGIVQVGGVPVNNLSSPGDNI